MEREGKEEGAGELVESILAALGSAENIRSVSNCMTRLRIELWEDTLLSQEELRGIPGVLGLVHDRPGYVEVVVGPGISGRCAQICHQMGLPSQAVLKESSWEENKAAHLAGQKRSRIRELLKALGDIFVPLIPGIITAGLCGGLSGLLRQVFPQWESLAGLRLACTLLGLVRDCLLNFLTAWSGYRAAERFGGTPILGGMLGMMTGMEGVNGLSQIVGLWNEASPLDSYLRAGRGGVLGTILGVLVMAKVEKWVRAHMPKALDTVFTPLLTLLFSLLPYFFLIMPMTGMLSALICRGVQAVSRSSSLPIRILFGYLLSALFLPLVAGGLHHGLVALYTIELEQLGYITLYPALCMAGAGQVGAALAIYAKARRVKNEGLLRRIEGALPAGILGVGEPLIYGVTLPMGKPFLTAGLGAGFGGALVMGLKVGCTTWGASGILGAPSMTEGPGGAILGVAGYLAGLGISVLAAYGITRLLLKDGEVSIA